ASTVATLFTLVIVLLLLQASVIGTIPAKQYEAERLTSLEAIAAFDRLRSMSSVIAVENGQFTVNIPLGTAAVSPFALASQGTLRFDPEEVAKADASFHFVPRLFDARLSKVDQDVVLVIDSSGSMVWNDPGRLRIAGAKDYVTHLSKPDRIAIVDFDSDAHLTKANVGQAAHHLYSPGHNGIPDYTEVNTDLDTIDQSGSTNYGMALLVAIDELITYGDRNHAWAIILLTDGENTACVPVPPCSSNSGAASDLLALQQASRAVASGIVIFTIGLGPDVNPTLLTQIAQTTGGTYYAAPNAQAIQFIYFEIAMHFKGFITCGTLTAANPIGGSLSLSLGNRQYPSQTVRMESSGVAVSQVGGGLIHEGIPVRLEPSGLGTGTLRLTLLTFVGPAFTATGSQYEFLTARFLGASTDDTMIVRPNLGNQSQEVGNIAAFIEFWGNQSSDFVTPGAVAAIKAALGQASDRLDWGEANMTAKQPTLAKFNTDSAISQLAAAALEVETQSQTGNMDPALANATKNDILRVGCQLDQWENWYNGVTFTIQSPNAAAWATWFNETFRLSGLPLSYGVANNQVLLTIRAIDRFIVDERVIALSFD
ncbi:MAG: vWA domain-containing protein, partial [Thermoplasmata archaeon]